MGSKELRSRIKRKHVTLTIINKLKVIEQLESGVSGRKIAEKFGIGQQTVSDIKKQKESIKTFALKFDVASDKSSVSNRQTLKKPKEVLLEEAVLMWYSQQRSSGVGVRGVEIKATAEKFAKHLKLNNFTCSSGWLWRFRQRHSITKRKIGVEALSDVDSAKQLSGLPENTKDWLKPDEGDPGFQLLTESIAADAVKESAIKERSDNELHVSPIKNKFISARDGIDAVINYVGSSTSQQLQEYYEHLRTVRQILTKEQQQRYVHTKLDSSFNLHYCIQNEAQLMHLLWLNKCIVFFCSFLNKGSAVIFFIYFHKL
jgi:Trp operon repressor